MDLAFRQMTQGDIPSTFSVRLSTVENAITMERLESDYGITPESVADTMASDVKGWICEDAGVAVGFAMGNASNGEVLVVAVRPEYERKGIGKNLLARVRNWLFGAGHEQIWLLTPPDPSLRAYGFYRSLGWQGTGRIQRGDEVMLLRNDDAQV
jgi:GNAT superfamily N-acetyltransferase